MYTMYMGPGPGCPRRRFLRGSWNRSHLLRAPQFLWMRVCWGHLGMGGPGRAGCCPEIGQRGPRRHPAPQGLAQVLQWGRGRLDTLHMLRTARRAERSGPPWQHLCPSPGIKPSAQRGMGLLGPAVGRGGDHTAPNAPSVAAELPCQARSRRCLGSAASTVPQPRGGPG